MPARALRFLSARPNYAELFLELHHVYIEEIAWNNFFRNEQLLYVSFHFFHVGRNLNQNGGS